MKKLLFLICYFSLICFTAESTLLPNIRKTASSTKVNNEDTESSTSYSSNNNGLTDTSENSSDTNKTQTNLAILPDGKAYIGVTSYLSLRDEPFGKVLARLYNNEEIIIVGRDGDWYEVESEKGSGWIYGKCVFDSPNSNPKASDTKLTSTSDEDEEEEDDDDSTSKKSNGTYYYFDFDNPGDYKICLNFSNDETTTTQATNTKSTDTKNIKTKPEKKSSKNTKKTNKNNDKKKSKSNSNSKDNDKIDKNDHLQAAALWSDKVFDEILKYKCLHKAPKASSFAQIKKKRRISCTKSSSIVFQQAGIIPKGKIVGHTPNGKRGHSNESFDTALKKSVTNAKYLIKGTCDIVMVMKKYGDCPKWLRQKGIYYIQESNACISAGKGMIYSCNQTNKRYTKRSMFYRKSGYCKNHPILFAFVPRTNGKSNVPKNCGFKVKAAWGKGSSKIVDIK